MSDSNVCESVVRAIEEKSRLLREKRIFIDCVWCENETLELTIDDQDIDIINVVPSKLDKMTHLIPVNYTEHKVGKCEISLKDYLKDPDLQLKHLGDEAVRNCLDNSYYTIPDKMIIFKYCKEQEKEEDTENAHNTDTDDSKQTLYIFSRNISEGKLVFENRHSVNDIDVPTTHMSSCERQLSYVLFPNDKLPIFKSVWKKTDMQSIYAFKVYK